MNRFLIALTLVLATSSTATAAPDGWELQTLAGIEFSVPKGAEVTSRQLPERVNVVAVTHGDEVLIMTLYRGKTSPSVKQAVSTHAEEFERRVANKGTLRLGRDSVTILGRTRDVRTITHGMKSARERTNVAAVRLTKTTFVAAWTTPAKLKRTTTSLILKSISFK
ncbi:MAG: hypothetical protein ACPGU1_06790 [Myxococcota bacterium]